MTLPIKTLADVRALEPCYDPAKYAPEDWQGTALDVLKAEQIPAADRLWVVLHEDWIDDRVARLFAAWCIPYREYPAVGDAAWAAVRAAVRDAAWAVAWVSDSDALRDAQVVHLIEMLEGGEE